MVWKCLIDCLTGKRTMCIVFMCFILVIYPRIKDLSNISSKNHLVNTFHERNKLTVVHDDVTVRHDSETVNTSRLNSSFGCMHCISIEKHPKKVYNSQSSIISMKNNSTIFKSAAMNSNMKAIQRKRQELIHKICTNMGNTTYYHRPNKMSKLIFNEQYHLLYCRIAKIGTTSWKLILLVLSGELNNTNADYSFRKLHDRKYPSVPLSSNDKQNYTSFLFVRHPFKRLLSAYRDKFETTLEPSFKKIERQIISQYRPNASMTGRNMAPKVSFLEFVKFLLNYKPKSNFNEHWDFQHKVCSLCDRSFDFIGHFENMEKESNYLLNYIGATDVFFPDHKYNFHVTNSTDENIYLKYFSQIPPKYIIKLYELYKMDFDLFGYSFPDELF